MKTGPKVIWSGFLVGVLVLVGWFLSVELPAALNEDGGDTLSEFIWWLQDVGGSPVEVLVWIVVIVLAILALWLVVHFPLRGKHPADRWFQRLLARLFKR